VRGGRLWGAPARVQQPRPDCRWPPPAPAPPGCRPAPRPLRRFRANLAPRAAVLGAGPAWPGGPRPAPSRPPPPRRRAAPGLGSRPRGTRGRSRPARRPGGPSRTPGRPPRTTRAGFWGGRWPGRAAAPRRRGAAAAAAAAAARVAGVRRPGRRRPPCRRPARPGSRARGQGRAARAGGRRGGCVARRRSWRASPAGAQGAPDRPAAPPGAHRHAFHVQNARAQALDDVAPLVQARWPATAQARPGVERVRARAHHGELISTVEGRHRGGGAPGARGPCRARARGRGAAGGDEGGAPAHKAPNWAIRNRTMACQGRGSASVAALGGPPPRSRAESEGARGKGAPRPPSNATNARPAAAIDDREAGATPCPTRAARARTQIAALARRSGAPATTARPPAPLLASRPRPALPPPTSRGSLPVRAWPAAHGHGRRGRAAAGRGRRARARGAAARRDGDVGVVPGARRQRGAPRGAPKPRLCCAPRHCLQQGARSCSSRRAAAVPATHPPQTRPRAPRRPQATPLPTLEEAGALCDAGLSEVLVAYVYERVEVGAWGGTAAGGLQCLKPRPCASCARTWRRRARPWPWIGRAALL
jgi:hypothetical protein